MPRFYIQYQNNSPVPILTQTLPSVLQGEEPIVADLIGAYKTAVAPLLDHSSVAQLTLHAAVDSEALDPDVLISSLSTGGTAKTALIIKSKNDMEVDSGAQSGSSINKEVIQKDGIDINTEHLERRELLEALARFHQYRFVRLTSPAASGKSSLLKLYQHSLGNRANVVWINCMKEECCIDQLKRNGIDLTNHKVKANMGYTIVFLDDAQAIYNNAAFWVTLIKVSPNWLPSTVRFIISSTHLLSESMTCPVYMSSIMRLERKDFLLSHTESKTFLELSVIGLPESMRFPSLIEVLVNECGGLIGALSLSVDSLKRRFAKDVKPSELALLQHCLSKEYVSDMGRCFGSSHSYPIEDDFKRFLKQLFVDEKVRTIKPVNPVDQESFLSLEKAGILVELPDTTFVFSSVLAKRYYFNWIFPNRSITPPTSLHELVQNVVRSMSSNLLAHSTVAGDFPKETAFQHLFLNGLANFTTADCSICSELSKILPDVTSTVSGTIAGEIDFYLNGDLHWGIELLVNGDRIGEHIARFSSNGKYSALGAKDYVVVDFRHSNSGEPTNIEKHEKRVTVFFKTGDYSRAKCLFGFLEAVSIYLEQ